MGVGTKAISLSKSSLRTTGMCPRLGARISLDGNCLASSICSAISIFKTCSSRLSAAFFASTKTRDRHRVRKRMFDPGPELAETL